jgi:hypothetical protein
LQSDWRTIVNRLFGDRKAIAKRLYSDYTAKAIATRLLNDCKPITMRSQSNCKATFMRSQSVCETITTNLQTHKHTHYKFTKRQKKSHAQTANRYLVCFFISLSRFCGSRYTVSAGEEDDALKMQNDTSGLGSSGNVVIN